MTKFVFDPKIHCGECDGEGTVPVPATILDAPTRERCEACGGSGLNGAARIAKLEATVKLLQRAVRKVYQDVPEMWEESIA